MLASPGHCGNHRILHGHHGNRSADAQSSSARTITLVVVPFPAGGPTDTIGRIIAEGLQSSLGQPFNHRKRAGGDRQRPDRQGCARGGRRAHADPGTIATHVFNGAAYPLKYDVVADFEPIALIAFDPQIIVVRKELPVADFAQLIAWLKANPDKATAGTASVGSTSHISAVFSTGITPGADFVCPFPCSGAQNSYADGGIEIRLPHCLRRLGNATNEAAPPEPKKTPKAPSAPCVGSLKAAR